MITLSGRDHCKEARYLVIKYWTAKVLAELITNELLLMEKKAVLFHTVGKMDLVMI